MLTQRYPQSVRSVVGIGSRLQVIDFEYIIICVATRQKVVV